MKAKFCFGLLMLFGTLLFAFPCFAADYYLYCANGRIVIDTRNISQLIGSGVYSGNNIQELGKYSDPSMAQLNAQSRGGVGSACGSAKPRPKPKTASPTPSKPKPKPKPKPVEETWTPQTLPAGFIAMSPEKMPWEEAKAYCASQGGKLPRFENSDNLSSSNMPKKASIDGFGVSESKLPEGLPKAKYWTGTAMGAPNKSTGEQLVWIIEGIGGAVGMGFNIGNSDKAKLRVICVP
ncbi:C-type lectin domain-containing protein [Desulfovibrio sp. OttesenSCG-928-C14]|nr:C-type lectin domain-containing protein [Desulfovibrio sp. OttesenSCG-928-C14]